MADATLPSWPELRGLRRDGRPIDTLYDRWQPVFSVVLSPEFRAIILQDMESGKQAVWFVDADGTVRGTHVEWLTGIPVEAALAPVADALADIAAHSLPGAPHTPATHLPAAASALASQFAMSWSVRHLNEITILPATAAAAEGTLSGRSGPVLDAQHVARLMQARGGEGPLLVPSPFDGAPLRAQIAFATGGLTVHRFYDPAHDAAFYLAWGQRAADRPPAFFCPRAGLILSDQPEPAFLPGHILTWYLTHPEHPETIARATKFEPLDYGLGNASTIGATPPPLSAEAEPVEDETPHLASTSRSAAWDYLNEMAAEIGEDATYDPLVDHNPLALTDRGTPESRQQTARPQEHPARGWLRNFLKRH